MAADLQLSGLASGFDWKTVVEQLAQAERAPQARMRTEQNRINQTGLAYNSLKTELLSLQSRADTLKDADLFSSRSATSSDTTTATVSADAGAPLGAYSLNFTQLATAAAWRGATGAASPLATSSDVSGLVLSGAGFATAVTAGTFTVNGHQITVSTSDTLKSVFDNISSATGGGVTAAYDPATDRISLTGSSAIILGSATDSSNFLQAARLANNGTGSVTSSAALAGLRTTGTLGASNFNTAVSDGGSGAGAFKINGVTINFSTASDSVQNVMDRINGSAAGVTASYDSVTNRFALTNKTTGDVGVALEDVTGNFLAATGLSGGSLSRGKDLLFTVNGGGTLRSHSNLVGSSTTGLPGLSLTALKEGTATVTVATDTTRIRNAITGLVDQYNRVQSMIDAQTASTTNANGKVSAGTLTADSYVNGLARSLRSKVFDAISGLTGSLSRTSDLGYDSNGTDNNLTLSDAAKLDAAISNNLSSVQDLFTNSTKGLATNLSSFLEATAGEEGTITTKQSDLSRQLSGLDTQIADQEKLVLSHRTQLVNSFVAMETAQANVNQQLAYLAKTFK